MFESSDLSEENIRASTRVHNANPSTASRLNTRAPRCSRRDVKHVERSPNADVAYLFRRRRLDQKNMV